MAKLENGFTGNAHGKVGDYVFYTLYGKPCVRSRPRRGSFKQTPARKRQQERMNAITGFMQHFKCLVKITFAGVSMGRAPYHTAFSYNAKQALKEDASGKWTISYPDTLLSVGPVVLPMQTTVRRSEEGLHFNWVNNEGDFQDTLVVIIQHLETKGVAFSFTGTVRKGKTYTYEPIHAGQVHVWLAFRSADHQCMSHSLYLGIH